MLDLKLATFLSLCETRNYTQTASLLNITQPAVSQHIKYLEKYYKTKLFYYDEKRRLHLTEKGKLLRSFAQTIRSDSALILEEMMAPPKENSELKLGTVTTAGESLVPHMIAEYLKKYLAVANSYSEINKIFDIKAEKIEFAKIIKYVCGNLLKIEKIGPGFEKNEIFPDRVNTEFIQIIDRKTIKNCRRVNTGL